MGSKRLCRGAQKEFVMETMPIDCNGEAIRDLATKNGTYRMIRTTLGEYLKRLGMFDPATMNGRWDVSVLNVTFQRAVIPIRKNPIKRRMLRDMLRGGTLPPTVLVQRPDERDLVV